MDRAEEGAAGKAAEQIGGFPIAALILEKKGGFLLDHFLERLAEIHALLFRTEKAAQLARGPEKLCPDVARSAIQADGDLADIHMFPVTQGEYDLLPGREIVHRALDAAGDALLDRDIFGGGIGRRGILGQGVQGSQLPAVAVAAAEMIDGAMDADPVDPGSESSAFIGVERPDPVEGLEKRLLDDVLRVFPERNVAAGQVENPAAVAQIDMFERFRTPLLGCFDRHLFCHGFLFFPTIRNAGIMPRTRVDFYLVCFFSVIFSLFT